MLKGLSSPRKRLPCQYFYDAAGSELFEEITQLEEYYPTRTETAILRAACAQHGAVGRPPRGAGGVRVRVEPQDRAGACRARGTARLCAHRCLATALADARDRLEERFPGLEIAPVNSSFCEALRLPARVLPHRKLGFFPGSTIGNFDPPDAGRLLAHFGRDAGRRLAADRRRRSRQGPTAARGRLRRRARALRRRFNLNLLARINRELGGDIDVSRFQHRAIYDQDFKRIEMHLVSRTRQTVRVLGRSFAFAAGESIHTENSYKYSAGPVRARLARGAGWQPAQVDGQNAISACTNS